MKAPTPLDYFHRVVGDRYGAFAQNLRPGQKALGWMCTYFPEEVPHAAGMYSVRVLGGDTTSYADTYLHINMCSLVRSVLDEALLGKYKDLYGFATLNTCDNIRRLYDAWEYFLQTPFTHILALPHRVDEAAIAYFRDEIGEFKEKLEKALGERVSDDALWQSIEVHNRKRTLLQKTDELRSQGVISGTHFAEVVLSGMLLPPEAYIAKLEELSRALEGQKDSTEGKSRLLVAGSELDDPRFIGVLEDLGAAVVADDLCTGSKYYWTLVENGRDPLAALARRYLIRPPCPRMRPADERINHTRELIRSHRVDGVVIILMRFCKLHDEGSIALREALEEDKVPTLTLSREYSFTGSGGIRTRAEAFLESLSGI